MNIFITGNIKKENFYSILENIIHINSRFSHQLFFHNKLMLDEKLIKEYNINGDHLIDYDNKILNFVICIGGDGSFLSTIRLMGVNQLPIIGVHIGKLGFLNQANKNNYRIILEKIFSDQEYSIIKHKLITAKCHALNYKDTRIIKLSALNDIVVKHGDLLRLIRIDIKLDSEHLNTYAADGVIFSTPIGSTAYSLSSGGPIILPEIDSMVITPISPHSLSARPIVIDGNKIITITFPDKQDKINIVSDGQVQHSISNNYKIEIKISKIESKFVFLDSMENYYSKLKSKIGWFGSSHK